MWTWIKNFFSKLFGSSVTQQLLVEDATYRLLKGNVKLAVKVNDLCAQITSVLSGTSLNSIGDLNGYINHYIDTRMELTMEERMLLGTMVKEMIGNVQQTITDKSITEPLKQLSEAGKYIAWVQAGAVTVLKGDEK